MIDEPARTPLRVTEPLESVSPLGPSELLIGFISGAMVRGLLVGALTWVVALFFTGSHLVHLGSTALFLVLSAYVFSVLGLIAGIWAEKFDQLAAFQNFLIMPLTFLSGVFYSIHTLPPFWQALSHFNPIFYMIDGFRYGFFGLADVEPFVSLAIVASAAIVLALLTLALLASGWKLRR